LLFPAISANRISSIGADKNTYFIKLLHPIMRVFKNAIKKIIYRNKIFFFFFYEKKKKEKRESNKALDLYHFICTVALLYEIHISCVKNTI